MSKKIKPENLGDALTQELTMYSQELTDKVNTCSLRAIERLVKLTRATAPVGLRKGRFKRHITYTEQRAWNGAKTFVWHVKAPEHRLTHLLVHGHATRTGGRTKPNPFLANAVDQVIPEYEREVEEACRE